MHTFVDDYRQEFFWRKPEEGLLVAWSAGVVTAPDFTVYNNDPAEWRQHQAWRSISVARYWAASGVQVLPVVSFDSGVEAYVEEQSTWAVRGPAGRNDAQWLEQIAVFIQRARAGRLVVFGRCPAWLLGLGASCPVLVRSLRQSIQKAA